MVVLFLFLLGRCKKILFTTVKFCLSYLDFSGKLLKSTVKKLSFSYLKASFQIWLFRVCKRWLEEKVTVSSIKAVSNAAPLSSSASKTSKNHFRLLTSLSKTVVFWPRAKPAILTLQCLSTLVQFCSSFNIVSKILSPFMSSFLKIMSPQKSCKSDIDPSQFLRLLKQMLVKSGRPHFNIFKQQNVREILACILYERCCDFIFALDFVQVKTRVTIDCLSCQQCIENEDSFTIFQLPVANTVQSCLDLFLTPEHLSGDNSFFYDYCSSLQPTIIDSSFCRVGHYLIIQLKWFVNFQETVTKDINFVVCFANISIPVIFDRHSWAKEVLIFSTVNHSQNVNNGHTAHVKNNFAPTWYYCSDAAVISCSKEVFGKQHILYFVLKGNLTILFLSLCWQGGLASSALFLGVTTPPITPVQENCL